eukprot:3861079-Rhodomonas_salina.1
MMQAVAPTPATSVLAVPEAIRQRCQQVVGEREAGYCSPDICLRACYALSGTDRPSPFLLPTHLLCIVRYRPTQPSQCAMHCPVPTCSILPICYALSGTDLRS